MLVLEKFAVMIASIRASHRSFDEIWSSMLLISMFNTTEICPIQVSNSPRSYLRRVAVTRKYLKF